jgi:hypothetical protein
MAEDVESVYSGRHSVELEYKPGEWEGDEADKESFDTALEVLEETDRYKVENRDKALGMAVGATDDYDELLEFITDTDLYVSSHTDMTEQ